MLATKHSLVAAGLLALAPFAGAFATGPALRPAGVFNPATAARRAASTSIAMGVFDGLSAKDTDGKEVNLGDFSKVPAVLVVNLASRWGATASNYKDFAEMTAKYSADKFVVLGFPCNQFGAQEPGTDAEIKKFAESKGVKMPPFYLMAKTDVNGANQHPLYAKLKEASGSGDLEWNFGKFMVTKGDSVKRYPIRTAASDTIPDIEAAQ